MKDLFWVVVGQSRTNVFDHAVGVDFLVLVQQRQDDVEQAQPKHLLGKDFALLCRIGGHEAFAQLGEDDLVLWGVDKFEDFGGLDQGDGVAELAANFVRQLVDVGQMRVVVQQAEHAQDLAHGHQGDGFHAGARA